MAIQSLEKGKQVIIDSDQLNTSPPEWLVDGMIPRVGTGFWYGPRWTGKSLAIDVELALAVANGTEFFDRKTVKGNVIVGLGEGASDAGVRKDARLAREDRDRDARAEKIALEQDWDVAEEWLRSLPAYNGDNLKHQLGPFALPVMRSEGEGEVTRSMRAFITQAKRYRPELVILDSLSDFTGGLSISNDTSANRVMLGLKTLSQELNCFVLAVAHPTERGDKMLGAGRLGNAADFVARSSPEGRDGEGRMISTVSCEKNKFGDLFEPFSYIIEPFAWMAPQYDDEGYPAGKLPAKSATIRSLDREPGTPTMEGKELETGDGDNDLRKRSSLMRSKPKQNDPIERVFDHLKQSGDWVRRSEISAKVFRGHASKDKIDEVLGKMIEQEIIRTRQVSDSTGRKLTEYHVA